MSKLASVQFCGFTVKLCDCSYFFVTQRDTDKKLSSTKRYF
jgi:hypothetical protein